MLLNRYNISVRHVIAQIRIIHRIVASSSLLLGMLASFPLNAQHSPEHHHDAHHHRSGEAHVHGIAELFIVLDGDMLDIALHAPAINLLGFEQKARTSEQLARLENVRAILMDHANLFQIEQNPCLLVEHNVDFSSLSEQHSNIEAHYRYQCTHADKVSTLSTAIQSIFPEIHALQIQWIVKDRQGSTTLHTATETINFQ